VRVAGLLAYVLGDNLLSTVRIGLALGWLGWHLSGRFAQSAS